MDETKHNLLHRIKSKWPIKPTAHDRNLAWDLVEMVENSYDKSNIMRAEAIARLIRSLQ